MLKFADGGGGAPAPQPAGELAPSRPPVFFSKTEHARGRTNNVANIHTSIRTTATTTDFYSNHIFSFYDPYQSLPLSPPLSLLLSSPLSLLRSSLPAIASSLQDSPKEGSRQTFEPAKDLRPVQKAVFEDPLKSPFKPLQASPLQAPLQAP